jgi:hypothetical protein
MQRSPYMDYPQRIADHVQLSGKSQFLHQGA